MRRTPTLLAVALALLLASCGTRLPDSAFSDSAQPVSAGARRDATGTDAGGDTLDNGGTTDTTLASGSDTGTNTGSSNNTSGGAPSAPGDTAPNRASDTGVTATTITIGNITAENGVLGDAFAPAVRGVRAWVAYTNAHGGIHGRQIVLKTCDDREDRNRDLACAQQLVERDKVFALIGVNSRSFGGAAQYLADHQIPVLGFPITNSLYRYPTMFSIYRNGYARDGKTVGYNGNLVYTSGWMRWFHKTL
ncbi:MAG TPA: ABC transporter substrate-binding protein, partial [Acidimicrobiales bacterium]|nr:ABC transporter substrate-binding protein [Acidimicrobiales bacterium]